MPEGYAGIKRAAAHLDPVPMCQALGINSGNSVHTDWITSLAGYPDLCAQASVWGSRKPVRDELAVRRAPAAHMHCGSTAVSFTCASVSTDNSTCFLEISL